ncbi:MAG: class I adenylate cyclase [Gammaproteobacteria bacterium]|nr:class I adenylate cyclase [Gammaproteobacteria bacterium]
MEPSQALSQFQSINRTRIERLRELAPQSQHAFFDVLALLFHINAEGLPAYISSDTPAGFVDFQPSDTAIDAAKTINPHFDFKRRPLRRYPLQGIYLINDAGSIQYPNNAEFELWLVHSDSSGKLDLLQQKLTAIEEWAKSLKITLHTRLLSVDALSQNSLSAEDLNRFYLNGLVLAGSAPLWWVISPEQEESNYEQVAQSLTQQRLLGHSSTLDFGPLPEASSHALLAHASSLLLSAIEQGIEPLLDLLYYQHQLSTFADISWPCKQLKQLVYQGEREPLFLDSSVLKLTSLMADSSISNEDQLLAQQSLYIAFNERLSKQITHAQFPWRRKVGKQLMSSWQWPQHIAQTLDQRQESTYRHCLAEYELVSKLHLTIKKSITDFAKKHAIDITDQNKLLRQKYQLFHDVAPNVIPYLPNELLPNKNKEEVYLHRFSTEGEWLISDMHLGSAKEQALFNAPSLLNVITWAVRNHILTQSNQLKIADHTEQISASDVLKLVQQLLRSPLSAKHHPITEASLAKAPECNQLMLFMNLEHQGPQDKLTQQGLVRSSLQNDPLNYALKKQNLVFTVEGLIYSSWGQWHHFSHTGNTAVLDMLNSLLLWQPHQSPAELVLCWCPSDAHGKAIERRVEMLYRDVITHYKAYPSNGNYLISLSEAYYQIQWQAGSCDFSPAPKEQTLLEILGTFRTQFSATKVDTYSDSSGLFKTLLRVQSPKQLTLFLTKKKNSITLYLLDERGTLFQQNFEGLSESTLTNHFHRFLHYVKQKNTIQNLRFYRLTKASDKSWKVNAMPLSNISQQEYLPVTVEMSSIDIDAHCTIHCGSNKFSGKANDRSLFQQVNELVMNIRKSHNRYPLYITNLSFPQDVNYSTYHYITQKQRLENLLN